ncbi:MAG: galactose oxidase-like domain-containing protein [Gemmatimonadales bacterium]
MHRAPVAQVRLAGRLVAAFLACATMSCQDTLKPSPPGGGVGSISVAYVCDNDFDLQSLSPTALTARYAVAGTPEQGELLLSPRSGESTPSTTRLATLHRGALQVSYRNEEIAPVSNGGVACAPDSMQEPQATSGEWAAPFEWPVVAVHLHLLPSGQVLSWGRVGEPQVWDPATGEFTAAVSATMLFCSGHAFLPDGRLLVTGGHISDDHGLPDANIFDAATRGWTAVAPMARGRWYPTNTTLPDGEVLTLAGRDEAGVEVDVPEVWTGNGWRALVGASRELPYYPRTFVAPNGLVFYAGELPQTSYLDPGGAGAWTPVATSKYGRRDYGSAVMYRPGQVLIVGGSDPPSEAPTSTAEVIDLGQPAPAWRYTGSMAHARRQLNATLLPDGRVLATGGTSAPGFSDPAGAVHAAEVWDPTNGDWTTWAGNHITRVYHSTTLLLPDGRVLHSGSGDGVGLPREANAEIFSPPYLFHGSRPAITSAPDELGYGQQFVVATPDAGRVVRATLVRLASVTHAFDQNQRFLDLSLTRVAGGLGLTSPANGNLAPPGHYLLFILNSAGVPSLARIIHLG